MIYNTGNYEKYMTKNPLKRIMVSRFNKSILRHTANAIARHQRFDSSDITRILDAGCGEGFITNLLCQSFSSIDVTGLEYTEEALRIARPMNSRASFLQGDICRMPFVDSSFDIVVCTEVLEHLDDPIRALNELLRVAKYTVIITVPLEPWFRIGNMLVLKNVSRFGNPIDHINHWSFRGFATFLKDHSETKWVLDTTFPWIVARCTLYD